MRFEDTGLPDLPLLRKAYEKTVAHPDCPANVRLLIQPVKILAALADAPLDDRLAAAMLLRRGPLASASYGKPDLEALVRDFDDMVLFNIRHLANASVDKGFLKIARTGIRQAVAAEMIASMESYLELHARKPLAVASLRAALTNWDGWRLSLVNIDAPRLEKHLREMFVTLRQAAKTTAGPDLPPMTRASSSGPGRGRP